MITSGGGCLASEVPLDNYPIARNYKLLSAVSDTTITADTIKQHLRIPITQIEEDVYLLGLLSAARGIFETATDTIILQSEFLTYRDCFNTRQFVLTKHPFVSLTNFEYTNSKDTIKTVNPANYQITDDYPYSRLILINNKSWIDDELKVVKQAIHITFKAGFSDENGIYNDEIKVALLAIIAQLYENRGDCTTTTYGSMRLPLVANNIVTRYKILHLTNSNYLENSSGLC